MSPERERPDMDRVREEMERLGDREERDQPPAPDSDQHDDDDEEDDGE
jgi:hypothetical protein